MRITASCRRKKATGKARRFSGPLLPDRPRRAGESPEVCGTEILRAVTRCGGLLGTRFCYRKDGANENIGRVFFTQRRKLCKRRSWSFRSATRRWRRRRSPRRRGGDLWIRPLNPYSENYRACGKAAFAELKANARPALADLLPELSAYDTVCLGYLNWCGTMPMAVWTFLEAAILPASGFCHSARTRAAVWAAAKPTCAGCAPVPYWGEGSHCGAAAGSAQVEIREWLEAEAGHR